MAMSRNILSFTENSLTCIKKLKSGFVFLKILRFNSISAKKLVYWKYGEPADVVQCENVCLGTPAADGVLVKMLAAPVNPSDINTIQGVYPIRPPLPAIPGNEGVGEVVDIGSDVKEFEVGDKVIPKINCFGTWRTHVLCKKDDIRKMDAKLDILQAATLTVNPCTAYRMLEDFVKLQTNDTVIQNGANSAVGQTIIQMCSQRGIKTVNLVRNRPDIQHLKGLLKNLGATCVFTEEEIKSTDVFKSGALSKPKLALNCIGGKIAKDMMRQLEEGGTMVTYGGMSREPLTLPTSALIFNNIHFSGFWITKWNKEHDGTPDQDSMLKCVAEMFVNNQISVPVHKLVSLQNYKEALRNTINRTGFTGVKYILDFRGAKEK